MQTFSQNEIHFNIGGGRDNIARYNVFYNAHAASVDMDGRGINGGSNDKELHNRLKVKFVIIRSTTNVDKVLVSHVCHRTKSISSYVFQNSV